MSAASPSAALQPDLRAFIVYDRPPEGCIPFLVADQSTAPHLRPGDIALIDTADREPTERDLFLLRWIDGTTDIVETWSREGIFGCGPNGEMIRTTCWFVAAYNRPRSHAEWKASVASGGVVSAFTDGPYATEGPGAGYLQTKLVGRLVGILASTIEEPKRIEA